MASLRGEFVPIFSLPVICGVDAAQETLLVVVDHTVAGVLVTAGFAVSSVLDIVQIAEDRMSPPVLVEHIDNILAGIARATVGGDTDQLVPVLDVRHLIRKAGRDSALLQE